MPFKSDAQRKLCYLLKGKGQAGSWDCDEWSVATGKKKLPEHVKDQEEKKALKYTNKLPGGIGDKHKPSDFPEDELEGMYEEEKIHTSDPDIATELATDHLTQDKDYYKKLNKVKDSKEAAMRKVARLWSLPAKISKLAEVITGAGRGLGDEDEGVVNFDSSEGISKAVHKEPKKGPASSLTPVREKPKPYLARKALINATNKTFGTNPTGGRAFNKMSEGPQSYKSFDPHKNDWRYNQQARAKQIEDGNTRQTNNSNKTQPFDAGKIMEGLGKKWVMSVPPQTWGDTFSPVKYYEGRGKKLTDAIDQGKSFLNDASTTFKGIGNGLVDATKGAVGEAASGARPYVDQVARAGISSYINSGNGNPTPTPTPTPQGENGAAWINHNTPQSRTMTVPGAPPNMPYSAFSGGTSGAWDAFKGALGDDEAYQRVVEDSNRPNYTEISKSMGQVGDYLKQFKNFGGIGTAVQGASNAIPGMVRNSVGQWVVAPSITNADGLGGLKEIQRRGELAKGFEDSVGAIGKNLNNFGTSVSNSVSNTFDKAKEYAANSEGRRMAAGYTLPYANWMRANPWAKYMLGAGGLALGGYALNKMFNRGGEEEQGDEGNPVESNMAQGYNQQAYGTQNHTQPTFNRGR